MHLTRETLNRLVDEDLSGAELRQARAHLAACNACEAARKVVVEIRELAHEALAVAAEGVSFERMQAEVASAIAIERPLGYTERLKVWTLEFLRHRRPVWVPAGALAAAAVIAVFLAPGGEAQAMGTSRVLSVTTTNDEAIVFDVESEDGRASTGIVWITDLGGEGQSEREGG